MARNEIHIWLLTDQAELGRWCDDCQTSGGFRIPLISPSGMSYATGCITCRARKTADGIPTA